MCMRRQWLKAQKMSMRGIEFELGFERVGKGEKIVCRSLARMQKLSERDPSLDLDRLRTAVEANEVPERHWIEERLIAGY